MLLYSIGLGLGLWDDLDRWGGAVRRRFRREGTYVYVWLIHFVVQQKLTQHYKASIPPSKKMFYRAMKLRERGSEVKEEGK